MLLPYTTLTYYGPGAASMHVIDSGGLLELAVPRQAMRAGVVGAGLGDAPVLRPYRGRMAALQAAGMADMVATAHKRLRAGLRVLVSELSQDDVSGAVLTSVISPGLTLQQAIVALMSGVSGTPGAVLAAAQAAPIYADTRRMNGAAVAGTGQSGDLWRGA